MLPTSPSTYREIYRRMMDGAQLIGIAAIHNKSHSLFQVGRQKGINLAFENTPVLFFDNKDIKIGENTYSVKGDFNYGDKRTYIKNGNEIEKTEWVESGGW